MTPTTTTLEMARSKREIAHGDGKHGVDGDQRDTRNCSTRRATVRKEGFPAARDGDVPSCARRAFSGASLDWRWINQNRLDVDNTDHAPPGHCYQLPKGVWQSNASSYPPDPAATISSPISSLCRQWFRAFCFFFPSLPLTRLSFKYLTRQTNACKCCAFLLLMFVVCRLFTFTIVFCIV